MKVLMVSPSYDPIIGGTETVVKNLTTSLNKIGVETDILTFNMSKKWHSNRKFEINESNGFKIYRVPVFVPFKKFSPSEFLFRVNAIPGKELIKIIKQYDIIHYHDDVDLSLPVFSYFINKPKIFHLHTLDVTYKFYRKNPISRFLLVHLFKRYIAVSNETANLMGNLGAKDVVVLPNGVDTQKFSFCEHKKEKQILFVGRLDEKRKGVEVLLESMDLLTDNVHLVLAGPNVNSEYSKKILSLIDIKNKSERKSITYLGSCSIEDLIRLYQESTIFVCPSLLEPFGIVNIEAMACGTPVIGSNVGGIKDIIKNGENGLLFPPNDSKRLSELIQYLLNNEDVRIRFGAAGRKWVEDNYSWDTIAIKLKTIYEKMT